MIEASWLRSDEKLIIKQNYSRGFHYFSKAYVRFDDKYIWTTTYDGVLTLTTDMTVKQAQKLWGTLLDYTTTLPLESD